MFLKKHGSKISFKYPDNRTTGQKYIKKDLESISVFVDIFTILVNIFTIFVDIFTISCQMCKFSLSQPPFIHLKEVSMHL